MTKYWRSAIICSRTPNMHGIHNDHYNNETHFKLKLHFMLLWTTTRKSNHCSDHDLFRCRQKFSTQDQGNYDNKSQQELRVSSTFFFHFVFNCYFFWKLSSARLNSASIHFPASFHPRIFCILHDESLNINRCMHAERMRKIKWREK